MGLDASLLVQYGRWLGAVPQLDGSFSGVFQGDLGTSWLKPMSVVKLIALKWPVTLVLGLMALLIAQMIALPIGIYSALRQDKLGDYLGRSFAILCISVPGFWLATLVIVFPAKWWGYMPPIMLFNFADDPIGNLRVFILPAIVLGMAMAGMTMRMTRTMALEVLRQDYIRTAWAKGLRERVVVLRHALKNALIPVVTIVGMLSGSGRDYMFQAPWMAFWPGLALSIVIYGVNMFGDAVRDILDPRLRGGAGRYGVRVKKPPRLSRANTDRGSR